VLLRIPESKQEARFCQEIVAPSDLMLSQVTNLHPHAERLFFAAIRLQKADRSPGILGTLNPKQRCQMTNHGPDRPILRRRLCLCVLSCLYFTLPMALALATT
jgi:hypothetical protein